MNIGETLRFLVLAAQREGNRQFARQLGSVGVTPSQAEVLRLLEDRGGMTLREVGAQLICETGSPSRLVAGLVTAGLVQRGPHSDGRASSLSLTPAGAAAAEQVRECESALYSWIEERTAGLDPVKAIGVLEAVVAGSAIEPALRRRGLTSGSGSRGR